MGLVILKHVILVTLNGQAWNKRHLCENYQTNSRLALDLKILSQKLREHNNFLSHFQMIVIIFYQKIFPLMLRKTSNLFSHFPKKLAFCEYMKSQHEPRQCDNQARYHSSYLTAAAAIFFIYHICKSFIIIPGRVWDIRHL